MKNNERLQTISSTFRASRALMSDQCSCAVTSCTIRQPRTAWLAQRITFLRYHLSYCLLLLVSTIFLPQLAAAAPFDLNGDTRSDLLVQDANGATRLLLINDTTITSTTALIAANSGWTVAHIADFNGDGKADLIWRHTDGSVAVWLMDGASLISGGGLLGPNSGWRVTHTADFNGDGKADLVWRNDNDGSSAVWLMNGASLISGGGLLGPNSGWRVTHTADFNNDGKADLVWHNDNDGSSAVWLMNGTALISGGGLLGPNSGWRVTHTADFNGDGKADLVWRNDNDGASAVWLMNGASLISGGGLLGPNSGWRVTHTADFNNDGKADLVWRNDNDGSSAVWLMNGASLISGGGLLGPNSGWRVTHTADFNGDSKADLVWANDDGRVLVWLMNGAQTLSSATLLAAGTSVVVPSQRAAATMVPASAFAPWPVIKFVDALSFSARSGLETVWGDFFEQSESSFVLDTVGQTQELGNAANGNYAVYANLDLGSGADSFAVRVSLPLGTNAGSNTVEIRSGSATGALLGSCNIASTGVVGQYETLGCALNPAIAKGKQNVAIRFTGTQTSMRFNWFAFYARDTIQEIDKIQKVQSTTMTNRPAPSITMSGQPARMRALLPNSTDKLALSYGLWSPSKVGDCPKWSHDTYWVRGDDGKIYPTWHPPVDFDPDTGMYCTYGHEHGDDPRGSAAFNVVGMPPFGYVGEADSPATPSLQRREDHYGNKTFVANNWQMYNANGGQIQACDFVVKLHMGTHSPDALVNTAHEVFIAGQCAGQQPFNVKQFALFGSPGSFKEAEAPGCNNPVTPGFPANPPNQLTGGIHRAIPTRDCYTRGTEVDQLNNVGKRTVEFWLSGMLGGNLYTAVHDPSRFYDQLSPSKIMRTVDLCYEVTHPLSNTLTCQLTVASSSSRIP